MNFSKIRSCVGAISANLLLLTLSGCTSPYIEEPSAASHEFVQSIYVIAQVCLQTTSEREYVEFNTVSGYGPGGKMRSLGGGGVKRSWQTTIGQPVFEQATHRQVDLKALVISLDATESVFGQPQAIPVVGWSPWLPPESQNPRSDDVGFKLVYGKTYTHRTPDTQAPRVRYKLIRLADYLYPGERKRSGLSEEVIPACQ